MDRSFRLERNMTGLLIPETRFELFIEDQKQVSIIFIIGTPHKSS